MVEPLHNGLVWDREKWLLKKINAKDEKGWRDEQTASHSHVKFFLNMNILDCGVGDSPIYAFRWVWFSG